jgi:hypothetical protein
MAVATSTQTDLFAWARELERENKRIAEINSERVRNRGYLVFATDPSKGVDSAEYQHVYATEARTPNQAIAKIRPLAKGRRLQAFLTTGKKEGNGEILLRVFRRQNIEIKRAKQRLTRWKAEQDHLAKPVRPSAGRISARSRACRTNGRDLRRLDHPTSVTGDTHLCFGQLAFWSPINSTHLIPSNMSCLPALGRLR